MRAAPSFHSRMIPAGSVTTMASADSLTTAAASHSSVTPTIGMRLGHRAGPISHATTPFLIRSLAGHLRSRSSSIRNIEY